MSKLIQEQRTYLGHKTRRAVDRVYLYFMVQGLKPYLH